jgi:hypothetical protein
VERCFIAAMLGVHKAVVIAHLKGAGGNARHARRIVLGQGAKHGQSEDQCWKQLIAFHRRELSPRYLKTT